ncbi:MAG: phytoene/squalene synthase family protein, partial [Brevundimonas sp.]|nr:phytoene/squalene synthase family protein [Brevundimonas sp.]
MADPGPSLDEQVRAADPDRWLSSRFVADAPARAAQIARYAFEAEMLAIPPPVNQPVVAGMRYGWWR